MALAEPARLQRDAGCGGADIRADAKDLLQYALMGTSYIRNSMDIARPRVGLLNVGTEEHKGRAELKEAYALITDLHQRPILILSALSRAAISLVMWLM